MRLVVHVRTELSPFSLFTVYLFHADIIHRIFHRPVDVHVRKSQHILMSVLSLCPVKLLKPFDHHVC